MTNSIHDKVASIKILMEDCTKEYIEQLYWYQYVYDTKFCHYFFKHHVLIDGDLKMKKWWFILTEIK